MNYEQFAVRTKEATSGSERALATNRLIRNTYLLLSMTLFFSAAMAGVSMLLKLPHPGILITLIGFFGLFFLTAKLRNSVWGLVSIFALTGFMGLTIGPILNAYLTAFSNGGQLVMLAMGGTGTIFIGLSMYALTTRKDFSFLGGFLFVGLLIAIIASLAAMFMNIPGLQIAVSAAVIFIMSGYILYDTSNMVHGAETNYIMATISLYLNIYNLFLNLLQLLGFLSGDN